MIVDTTGESAGHGRWDWVYYVAAGVALSAPAGCLPWDFPVGHAVASLAAVLVVLRGVWWGWSRGRALLVLGGLAFVVNAAAIHSWIEVYAHLNRPLDRFETSIAERKLLETVWAIEYFKLTRDHYPADLGHLHDDLGSLRAWDSTARGNPDAHHFYYSRIDSGHYVFRAHGPDGFPFTADDVVPPIPESELPSIGFRPNRP